MNATYSSSKGQWALCYLQGAAERCVVERNKKFEDHVLQHHGTWFNAAKEHNSISAEELLVVRGWVKTSGPWMLAASSSHQQSLQGEFQLQLGNVGSTSVSITSSVYQSAGLRQRKRPVQASIDKHCMFVLTYKVRRRRIAPWTKKLEAGAGPDQLPDPEPDSTQPTLTTESGDSGDFLLVRSHHCALDDH